jgi:nucleoid DNA-binding protein
MNIREFLKKMKRDMKDKYTMEELEDIMKSFRKVFYRTLLTKGSFNLYTIGRFDLKHYKGYKSYNNLTRGEYYVKPRYHVTFKPSSPLKKYLNGQKIDDRYYI